MIVVLADDNSFLYQTVCNSARQIIEAGILNGTNPNKNVKP